MDTLLVDRLGGRLIHFFFRKSRCLGGWRMDVLMTGGWMMGRQVDGWLDGLDKQYRFFSGC